MKVILLLPQQKSECSIFFQMFANLRVALSSLGIVCRIAEVETRGGVSFPYSGIEKVSTEGLGSFFRINSSEDTYFVTVDDYALMRRLHRLGHVDNLLIWAHYFYGHKFLFQEYRRIDRGFPRLSGRIILGKLAGYAPNFVAIQLSRWYWETLRRYPVVAQSLWTELLLERVFSVPTLGTLLVPVDPQICNVDLTLPRAGTLVFLGDQTETSLTALHTTLCALGEELTHPIDYFGDQRSGMLFAHEFGINMNYLGKISRSDLSLHFSKHLMTIAPVYNGTFEMVPIESLLCGTPVVSFPQPFMEVVGESKMVKCIWNLKGVTESVTEWSNLRFEERVEMRERILKRMNSLVVASNLIGYLTVIKE